MRRNLTTHAQQWLQVPLIFQPQLSHAQMWVIAHHSPAALVVVQALVLSLGSFVSLAVNLVVMCILEPRATIFLAIAMNKIESPLLRLYSILNLDGCLLSLALEEEPLRKMRFRKN